MAALKVGIIGIGNQGSSYAEYFTKHPEWDVEIVAVADINPDRLQWAEKTVPQAARFDDAIAMLDSGLLEGCMINVPHYDHPTYAIECMKRGIHVMVDKPAGVYTKQVKEMNAVADAHPEVKFGMMFNQRTTGVYCKLRELVQSGAYGELRRMNWLITSWYRPQAYYDSGAWRATWAGEGGAVLMNQCPHQLDLLQWICGMPVKVQSHVHYGKWHDIETEDDATAYMEFSNGATGVFITATGDACGTNRLEIQMDKGRFVVENDVLKIVTYEESEPEFSKRNTQPFGVPKYTTEDFKGDLPEMPHAVVAKAWVAAIRGKGEMIADGREGLNGTMLANAMQLSTFLKREVTLPIDDEVYYEELMKRVAISKKKENVRAVVADTSGTFAGTK
ncbi:MAG: Gfo/Idh/MocA family oxidoreductase [Clostridia bacterium]|nr:Gfo/Idh/MocA family oxidoreductase [Clostridia bacterium]